MINHALDHAQNCPLAAVDRRLEDVHQLWHEAERNYFDPEGFRLAAQNAIQTLRTVTFILQKHKHDIPDFDAWYEGWRSRLGADDLMRWMVQARNKIEKQGDLEANSFVRAEIIASYLEEGPVFEVPAQLFNTSHLIFSGITEDGRHITPNESLSINDMGKLSVDLASADGESEGAPGAVYSGHVTLLVSPQ